MIISVAKIHYFFDIISHYNKEWKIKVQRLAN